MGMFDRIGRPHPGWNPHVHGPYQLGRWYGQADKKLGDVKLAELPAWIGRRSMNPMDWLRAVADAHHRWNYKWANVRKPGVAPLVQFCLGCSLLAYLVTYDEHVAHRRAKYHW